MGGWLWDGFAIKAIPVVVREGILKLYDQGKSTDEIAASFGYCVAAVRRVRQHFKARGTLEPQTHRCGRKSLLTEARKTRRSSCSRGSRTPRWRSWGHSLSRNHAVEADFSHGFSR
jgi:transposase